MSNNNYQRWVCDACGFIYDELKGDPDSGLAPGTRYADIPDNWECPLCGLNKSDLRLLPEKSASIENNNNLRNHITGKSSSKSRGGDDYIVIIGAGIAGWSVAESIRQKNTDIPILLISSCAGTSYPKPALSTAFANEKSIESLIEQDATSKADSLNIEVRTETRIIKIDKSRKRLTTSKGGIQYGNLILALGAHQRELDIPGQSAENVLRVNDLTSYKKLRQQLELGVKHITILGAGLIGCEFAEDLTTAGYQVSIIDPGKYPIASLLPENTGLKLKNRLQDKGITWHFNCTLASLEKSADHYTANLSDGNCIKTDLVLSAAGLVANTKLAQSANIETSNGIDTDVFMRTSDENIYALGDCASVQGTIFSYIEPIRRQATTIADHLFGEQHAFEIKPPLVTVKTPSFPLTICPPQHQSEDSTTTQNLDEERINYVLDDQIVGFIVSGKQANQGVKIYQQIFNQAL